MSRALARERPGPSARRRRPLGTALLAALALIPAGTARAAFDLRRAAPDAVGAASEDLAFDPLRDAGAAPGWSVEGSHASLYGVSGLAADRVAAAGGGSWCSVAGAWSRAGTPDLAEMIQSLALEERGMRAILLRARAERVALRFAGEPEAAGWTGSAGVRARIAARRAVFDVVLDADRILRSAGAERLGAEPAVVAVLRVRTPAITVVAADRWERSGRRSPRLAIEMPVASVLTLRAARGQGPGRVGFALTARWGSLEISAGRLDGAAGDGVASLGIRIGADEKGG